jgi:SAM-dependent methyltransferase
MPTLFDLLRCPTCKTALRLDAQSRCHNCGVVIKTHRSLLDFLPEGAHSALEGRSRPSWEAWSDRLAALERWRQARQGAPAAGQADQERLGRLVHFAQISQGALLDIGCGSASLRQHLPEEVSYFGIEPAPGDHLTQPENVVRGVAEQLPFDDKSFAHVTMLSVFDYFVEPLQALKEARRVLQSRGCLSMIITVRHESVASAFHAEGLLSPLQSLRREVIKAIGLTPALRLSLDQLIPKRKAHVSYFSEASLLALVQRQLQVEAQVYDQPGVLFLRLRKT